MPTQPKCAFCGDSELIDLELEFETQDLAAQNFYRECNPDMEPTCADCWQCSFEDWDYDYGRLYN